MGGEQQWRGGSQVSGGGAEQTWGVLIFRFFQAPRYSFRFEVLFTVYHALPLRGFSMVQSSSRLGSFYIIVHIFLFSCFFCDLWKFGGWGGLYYLGVWGFPYFLGTTFIALLFSHSLIPRCGLIFQSSHISLFFRGCVSWIQFLLFGIFLVSSVFCWVRLLEPWGISCLFASGNDLFRQLEVRNIPSILPVLQRFHPYPLSLFRRRLLSYIRVCRQYPMSFLHSSSIRHFPFFSFVISCFLSLAWWLSVTFRIP